MAEPEKEELTEGEKSVALICQVAIGAFLGIFLARDATLNGILNRHKQTAKTKNREWSLTKTQFESLIFSDCYYCGNKPSQFYNVYISNGVPNRRGSKTWFESGSIYYNGIDRKDNNIGYTTDNSLPCCFICNRAKLTLPYEEFMEWIGRLTKNYATMLHK